MSIIQTIRDKGSWVMVTLLVLALISFIFMDSGNREGIFGGSDNNKTVGSINGSKIKQDEFGRRVAAFEEAYKGNPQATREAINNAVWQMMVDEKTMDAEYKKFDEGFTKKSLEDMAIGKYGVPSQYITQLFKTAFGDQMLNQQGQLNTAQAEMALKQMRSSANSNEDARKFITSFEDLLPIVRYEYVSQRYNMLMGSTVYAPKWLATKKMADDNLSTNISIVNIPYSEVNDSLVTEVKVTDKEIQEYMNKYPTRFKTVETRDIDYTTFDFNPTGLDSFNITDALGKKIEKFKNTVDTANGIGIFVNSTGSTIPYANKYERKSELLLDSSASLVEGNVSGPFVKNGNFVIAKVVSVKNYADTASARHILIQTYDPNQQKMVRDDAAAKKLMDSVVALYRAGQPFDSLAKRFSDDPGSKDSGGLYRSFPLNQNSQNPNYFILDELNKFAFGKNTGDTGVVKTNLGYHFVKSEGTKGVAKPAYKVAYIAKQIVPSQSTKDSVRGVADAFASNNRTAKVFDEFFVKNPTKTKFNGYGITRDNLAINGLQDNTKDITKWAFEAKVNDVSEPYALDKINKYVVSKLARTQSEGTKSIEDARKDMALMNTLSNEKKYTYLAKKYGTPTSIEDAASKTGKQITVKDSVSYATAMIPGYGAEPRAVGYAFNPNATTKVSGPIKGLNGLFYVKANVAPYTNPSAASKDLNQVRKQMEQEMSSNRGANEAYRKKATIKDKRIETGY